MHLDCTHSQPVVAAGSIAESEPDSEAAQPIGFGFEERQTGTLRDHQLAVILSRAHLASAYLPRKVEQVVLLAAPRSWLRFLAAGTADPVDRSSASCVSPLFYCCFQTYATRASRLAVVRLAVCSMARLRTWRSCSWVLISSCSIWNMYEHCTAKTASHMHVCTENNVRYDIRK